MRIGELSKRTGVSVRMLRYYEEQGLLRPDRTESGYRVFGAGDVDRVGRIRCMISSALPSHLVVLVLQAMDGETSAYPVREEDCPPLKELLDVQLATINERIEDLVTSRDQLVEFIGDLAQRFPCFAEPPTGTAQAANGSRGVVARNGTPATGPRRKPLAGKG